MLILDFETRSEVDLKMSGADRYASDPSTDILCLCGKDFNTGDEYSWLTGEPFPEAFKQAIEQAPFLAAVNARFDQAIYEFIGAPDYGMPEVKPEQWYCVSAHFAVNGMPQSLDKAARAIGSKHLKNPAGKRLIKLLSCPPFEGAGNKSLMKEMLTYCMDDVRATYFAMKATRLMSHEEHADWLINERINDRGIRIDTTLAELAQNYAEQEMFATAKALATLTQGAMTKHTQTKRAIDWLLSLNLPTKITKLLKDESKVSGYSLDKATRQNLLALPLPPEVRDVVELIDDTNASSVGKFKRMIAMADPDDHRVRGCFVFGGASQTMRYSSKGLQLHNSSRECLSPEETDSLIAAMQAGEEIPDLMKTLRGAIRPALIPAEGHVFGVADWSAIEGRIFPWLANSRSADKVLDIFRDDKDIYLVTAKDMGGYDRQIGKVASLSLIYGGGKGAFEAMAKNYGITLPEHEIERVVRDWRDANAWAKRFWQQLEDAAMLAYTNPNKVYKAGRVTYIFLPQFLRGCLLCTLPDGSTIQYPHVKKELIMTPWGDPQRRLTAINASQLPKADATTWPRHTLTKSILANNITQASAAALLRHALRDCFIERLPVVAHVHDEVVIEIPIKEAQNDLPRLKKLMETTPVWAKGLPLKSSAELMTRYGK